MKTYHDHPIASEPYRHSNTVNEREHMTSPAKRILHRCERLRKISADTGAYFRTYLTPEHRKAAEEIMGWMRAAGMPARMDSAGNVVGRFEGVSPGMPAVVLGSHFDTVRDGGRYDGILGIATAIECIETLSNQKRRLPFALEVYGFADEEGARFPVSFIGSRAVTGSLKEKDLEKTDSSGVSLAEALQAFGLNPSRICEAARKPDELLAYLELHIEQGPRLEREELSVGAVTGIQGQTFLNCTFQGRAGHAGTVPMNMRRDALPGAAEAVLVVEKVAGGETDVVASVGKIAAEPGAGNVIPGRTLFSIDLRSPSDARRERAIQRIRENIEAIARQRKLTAEILPVLDQAAVSCDQYLTDIVLEACREITGHAFRMTSGAGHDAEVMSELVPVAMIFVRCKEGVSHHPDETVSEADVTAGYRTLRTTIEKLSRTQ